MKKLLTLAAAMATISVAQADAPDSNWFRQAAISPDGSSILFTAKGDIYQAPVEGGKAIPLVTDSGWDGYPVWSHDGKSIAFSSTRNGSLDVYVMDLANPVPQRLTFHSADDYPTDFSLDNHTVIFSSGRMPSARSSGFPTSRVHQLYSVPTSGGSPTMMLTTAAMEARVSPNGDALVYMDNKSYEDGLRKHDVSAFARDIWRYDINANTHTKLTDFVGGDSSPVWSADGNTVYFLSEKNGSNFNVWQMDAKGGEQKQLSTFTTHPVRSLSISDTGTLAYSWHGNLYTQKAGEKAEKLDIILAGAKHSLTEQNVSIAGKVDRFVVSPSGKEVAFIARGELFVSSVEYGTTVRLTNTPEQERGISWFPDGRSIAFASERDGAWGIYQVSMTNDDEPYFFAATQFEQKPLLKEKADVFQPLVSPDGNKLAYLYKRDAIRVLDLKKGKSKTVFPAKYNYSYSDGDIGFVWSPDSQWIAASFVSSGLTFFTDIGIAPADGSKAPVDVFMSGYGEYGPQWTSDDLLLFVSDRFGERAHGSWGGEIDVMGVFLTQQAFDHYNMSKEERELLAEAKEQAADDKSDDDADKQESVKAIEIDWDDLDERVVRLTKHSSELAGFMLTPDQEKLYYLAQFEKGYDLWVQDFKEKSTKLALKLNASSVGLSLNEKGDTAVLLADGVLSKLTLGDSIKQTPIGMNGTVAVKADDEREYLFNHIWRQTKDKFYNPNMHGIDWELMHREYLPKARAAGNNRDFAIIASELLGELNASHTGARYRGKKPAEANTATLGVLFEMTPTKAGLKVAEILPYSPLKHAEHVNVGSVLTAVDGMPVNAANNLYKQLNGKAGKRTRLSFKHGRKTHDVVVRPQTLADESKAMYKRWVDSRRDYVEKQSDGKLAYVHVPQMNDAAYRQVYAELFGRGFDKQAVVVDTRFNRGGWLTDDLVTLLSGEQYSWMVARGNRSKGNSMKRWSKPSALLVNEGNYSDGNCFPNGYRANQIGTIVGMPVPGTCTAVWWEGLQTGDIVFGIPQLGVTKMDGTFMENNQLEPDVLVENTKESTAKGEDLQLKRAIDVLLNAAN